MVLPTHFRARKCVMGNTLKLKLIRLLFPYILRDAFSYLVLAFFPHNSQSVLAYGLADSDISIKSGEHLDLENGVSISYGKLLPV